MLVIIVKNIELYSKLIRNGVKRMITLKKDKCQGCGLCIEVCPKKILNIDKSSVNSRGYTPIDITDKDSCIACALCAMMCPDLVFEISKEVTNGTEADEGK